MNRFSVLASAAFAAWAASVGFSQEVAPAPVGSAPTQAAPMPTTGAPLAATPAVTGGGAPLSATPLLSGVGAGGVGGCASGNCGGGGSDGCGSRGCGRICCNDPCNPHFWIYGEYLGWWTKGDRTPALLDRLPLAAGAGTTLIGGELNDDYRQGVRAGGGFFVGKCNRIGFEAEWMSLGRRNDTTFVQSDQTSVLVRPIVPTDPGAQPFVLLSSPGQVDADVLVNHRSALYGGNLGFRKHLKRGCDSCGASCDGGCGNACKLCLDVTWGYRYFQLDERLDVGTQQSSPAVAGVSVTQADSFQNANQFHGGYLGFAGEYNCGKWFWGINGKASVGYIQQTSTIDGFTEINDNGVVLRTPGGVLAQPSNIGTRVRNEFGFIPQIGLKVGYQLTCRIRSYVGYDFIWINNVLRPGDTIDTTVNLNQAANLAPLRPTFVANQGSFWAHGLNAGMEIKF